MNGEPVSKPMRGNGLTDAGESSSLLAGEFDRVFADVPAGYIAWEEPLLRPFNTPPTPQGFQQFRRQHHVTILLAFTLIDADDHALAIDVGCFQTHCLRDAQAGSVASGQDRAVLRATDTSEKLQGLFGAQYNRQSLRLLRRRDDFLECPGRFLSETL